MTTEIVIGVDAQGAPLDIYSDAADAARDLARRGFSDVWIEEDDGTSQDIVANPAEADAQAAWSKIGKMNVSYDDVMSVSLKDAHRAFASMFPVSTKGGDQAKRWSTPKSSAERLLALNAKIEKVVGGVPAVVVGGLGLLPANYWSSITKAAGFRDVYPVNLCVGASEECRSSCLLFSGQNIITYANLVKHAKTTAFLRYPLEFCRMLFEACEYHRKKKSKTASLNEGYRFVRLNLLSDIPWELVFPDLIQMMAKPSASAPYGLGFYDYTKVTGRGRVDNYDLTFSWSGINDEACQREMEGGRRVAMVFLAPIEAIQQSIRESPRRTYSSKDIGDYKLKIRDISKDFVKEIEGAKIGLFGKTFDVVNGEISDLRWFDPSPGVVALAYKPPMKFSKTLDLDRSAFLVRARLTDDGLVVQPVTPRAQKAARRGEAEAIAAAFEGQAALGPGINQEALVQIRKQLAGR